MTYFQPALPIFLSLACTAIAATQASAASVNTFTRVEVSFGGGVSTPPVDQTNPSADVPESFSQSDVATSYQNNLDYNGDGSRIDLEADQGVSGVSSVKADVAYWDGEQNTPAVARTELLMEITNDESVAAVQHFDFQISGGSLRIEEFSNGNPDTTNPFEEADAYTNGAKVSFEVQLDNVVLFSAYYSVWGAGGQLSDRWIWPDGDACRGYEPLFLRG